MNKETFNLRLSKKIREELDYLSEKDSRASADVIRLLIHDEYIGAKIIEKGEYKKEKNPARLIRRIICDMAYKEREDKRKRITGEYPSSKKIKKVSYEEFKIIKKGLDNIAKRVHSLEEMGKLKEEDLNGS